MARKNQVVLTQGQTEPDLFKVLKFYDLLKRIDEAKGRPEPATV